LTQHWNTDVGDWSIVGAPPEGATSDIRETLACEDVRWWKRRTCRIWKPCYFCKRHQGRLQRNIETRWIGWSMTSLGLIWHKISS